MAAVASAAGPGGLPLALAFGEAAAALAVLAAVLHVRRLARTRSDLRAAWTYFAAFFLLLLALPVATIVLLAPAPGPLLASLGWSLGRTGRGLAVLGLGLPLAVFSGYIGSRDPQLRRFYPFSKLAARNLRTFVPYELGYLFLYYLPWEFAFRGLFFFPLAAGVGLVPALAVQTALSTLYHLGHPETEIFAALGAGIVFGLAAWATGSILYTAVVHAAAGIATDAFITHGRAA